MIIMSTHACTWRINCITNTPTHAYIHTHTCIRTCLTHAHTHRHIHAHTRTHLFSHSGFRTPNLTQHPPGVSNTTTIAGEGHCEIKLQLTHPGGMAKKSRDTPPTSRTTILIVGSVPDKSLVQAVADAGLVVVEVSVCGFGGDDAFPSSYKGMAACPDLAQNLNRSIVGVSE